MNSQVIYFFFCSRTAIEEEIINTWLWFFRIIITETCMNGGPAKHRFNRAFSSMDKYALSRRYLVIHPTISFKINQTFRGNIIYKPADFISMPFNHHLKCGFWIYYTDSSTIGIGEVTVYIWFYIFEPKLLSAAFEADRGSVVEISL